MKWINTMKPLVICVLCASLGVTVGVKTGTAAIETKQSAVAPTIIQSVQLHGEGAGTELIVGTSVPSTYTSYKSVSPARLVVDFSQAVPSDALGSLSLSGGPVKGVSIKRFDTDAGTLTRMEIFLSQDIEPVITPAADKIGELRISFPGYVAVKPVPAAEKTVSQAPKVEPETVKAAPATTVSIEKTSAELLVTKIASTENGINIETTGPVNDYKTFRLNKPERVVIDVVHAKIGLTEKLIQLNTAGVSTARVGAYPDKVRIVFDASNNNLSDALITKTASGLHVSFQQMTFPAKPNVAIDSDATVQKPSGVIAEKTMTVADKPESRHVSAVDFQVVDGISRVMVKVTGTPTIEPPVKSAGTVSFRIKNTLLPRDFQRSLETREFVSPVLRVTPVQVKSKTGNDILVRVTLKTDAPFTFKQESDVIYLDIKNPVEAKADSIAQSKVNAAQKAAPVVFSQTDEQVAKAIEQPTTSGPGKRVYTGRKVTLEFADAEVRKIFQLLSEVSNKNFVLGDEVTGNISLKLVNVPWDQALDIILDTKGLDKREDGNIILIRGKGKFKSLIDEEVENRKAALKGEPLETEIFEVNYSDVAGIVTQFKALQTDRGVITSDARTNKVIVKDVRPALNDMAKLLKNLDVPEKQVMIEARIVEASADFTRSLGISWGLSTSPAAGGQNWPFINSLNSVFGGLATTSGSSAIGSTTGAADITFGTIGANVKLSMRLNAAAKAGLARIVSSPKVATLNNKSAKITQGKQIPYVSSTSDKVETKFVEAALSLEVTPHINNNGTIILKVDAKNDAPDTTSTSATPPINKKQATTEMLLKDGETTVIGGIFVDSESEGEEGVPWLMDIPIIGNLFRSTSYVKGKTELLIFITPRILTNNI